MTLKRAGGRSVCTSTGKKRYPSYFDARAAAATIQHEAREDHGKPYLCSHCSGWHLGRAAPPGRGL